MVKRKEMTTKVSKPKPKTISKRNATKRRSTYSTTFDATLPDGNFLDSFDKFIADEKKDLKANKVLKKKIRVSYNRDSSFDITQRSNAPNRRESVNSDDSNTKETGNTRPVRQRVTRQRKCNPQPIRVYKAKQTKKCDDKGTPSVNKRLKRPIVKLTAFDDTATDTTFRTPFILKRTKRRSVSPVFDKLAGLITSTPTTNRNQSKVKSPLKEWTIIDLTGKSHMDLTAPSTSTNKLIESIGQEVIEIPDSLVEVVPPEIGSFTRLINESSNFQTRKEPNETSVKKALVFQLSMQDHSNMDSLAKSISDLTTDTNENSASVLNVPAEPLANRKTIRFALDEKSSIANEDNVVVRPKLVIKSGKWRRTVYEIRNKIILSPKRSERYDKDEVAPRPSVYRRKSIFVRNIEKRKCSSVQPDPLALVLDESDVESNCSTDFSPKQTPINVLSKQRRSTRSSRLLHPIVDRITSKNRCELIDSRSRDSAIDELINLTSDLNFGYNQKLHLLRKCGQTEPLPFHEAYTKNSLKNCRKIGEGVFGEVFLIQNPKSSYVLKVIPIEGTDEINGAQQKRFDEILQEVIITQELSALRYDTANRTVGFVEVLNVRLVEGRYPASLLNLWNAYKEHHGTDNENPAVFDDNQLYIVFELANCGLDLEAFEFKNADQSNSVFKQTALSLAVAETKFEFEHRDLHWGNILVTPTTEKFLTFAINGQSIKIPSHGVKATIIDYTLSRILYKDCCLYQDLSADPELFEASGDYQYDIYRLMKSHTNGQWETFEPITNVLWLHYVIDKMIDGVHYSARKTIKHRTVIDDMMKLRDELLVYKSASDYALNNY